MNNTKERIHRIVLIPIHWLIINLIILVLGLFLYLFNSNGNLNVTISILVIALSVLSIYHSRNNWYMLIISIVIAYYNYSIVVANYISVIHGTMFTGYAGTEIGTKGLNILLVFAISLYIIFFHVGRKLKKTESCNIINSNHENKVIVIVLWVVLTLIWIFGFVRPTEVGQRGSPSTYFEYSIILVIAGFHYSGKSRLFQLSFVVFGAAYALLNFVYGGRATAVQVVVCVLLCTVLDRLPRIWIICGGFLFFMAMSFIGTFRTNLTVSSDALEALWHTLSETKFANDTAYSAYYTSLTFIDFAGNCTWDYRIGLFSNYLLSIVLGGSVSDSNLPMITRRYYTHYYGGVLPNYFYFYLGVFGVIIISLYIYVLFSTVVNRLNKNDDKITIWNWIGIYIASTSFRWYIYSPSQITRGVLILTIVYFLLYVIDKALKRNNILQNNFLRT